MRRIEIKVVGCGCPECPGEGNCLACDHFCGILRDELHDAYVVECGYCKGGRQG